MAVKRNLLVLTFIVLLQSATLFQSVSAYDYITQNAYANYTITIKYSVENQGGTIEKLKYRFGLIQNRESLQEADILSIEPYAPIRVDGAGNRYVQYSINALAKGESFTATMSFNVTVYAVEYKIDPSNVGAYDESSETFKRYTRPEKYIEADDRTIIETANGIAGDETNPYSVAKKIDDFVHSNIQYMRHEDRYGAVLTLKKKQGKCIDYSELFVALCRSKGIPSDVVYGFADKAIVNGGNFTGDQLGHAWAEAYIPNYGWVPADPTWGGSDEYFGKTDLYHIALWFGHTGYYSYCYEWFYRGAEPKLTAHEDVSVKVNRVEESNIIHMLTRLWESIQLNVAYAVLLLTTIAVLWLLITPLHDYIRRKRAVYAIA